MKSELLTGPRLYSHDQIFVRRQQTLEQCSNNVSIQNGDVGTIELIGKDLDFVDVRNIWSYSSILMVKNLRLKIKILAKLFAS